MPRFCREGSREASLEDSRGKDDIVIIAGAPRHSPTDITYRFLAVGEGFTPPDFMQMLYYDKNGQSRTPVHTNDNKKGRYIVFFYVSTFVFCFREF